MGGELARAIPIAVIGDAAFPTVPAPCLEDNENRNAEPFLAGVANGIIGVDQALQDCGSACESDLRTRHYYACDAAGCKPTTVPLAQQISNPVAFFKKNNNGVVFELPAPSSNRAQSLAGKLIFGIGTQDNNQLGNAKTYRSIPELNHSFDGRINGVRTLIRIDSGASTYVYEDSAENSIPICQSAGASSTAFFCPPVARINSVDLMKDNQFVHALDFTVENLADFFANPAGDAVFSHPGRPAASFISTLGLPFFYGRTVFIAIDGKPTPAGTGSYVAF